VEAHALLGHVLARRVAQAVFHVGQVVLAAPHRQRADALVAVVEPDHAAGDDVGDVQRRARSRTRMRRNRRRAHAPSSRNRAQRDLGQRAPVGCIEQRHCLFFSLMARLPVASHHIVSLFISVNMVEYFAPASMFRHKRSKTLYFCVKNAIF
jgi:hypothetical protein